MNKQSFINDLSRENSTFSTSRQAEMVANLLDTVSSDIYSESQRFVFELIQNADDAAIDTNNIVHFDFLPNCLIVSHNGKPFDENDIISLTSAGASTKHADPTKTGYKGIGFKSVFGKSERVTIFSDGYQFRFDKFFHNVKLPWQIIPIWTETKELRSEIQDSISRRQYAVSTIIEINKAETLLNDLNDLLSNGQILLFLRRVSKISVSQNGNALYFIERKVMNQGSAFNEVSLIKDGNEISSWLTKTFEQIPISNETKEALNQDEKTPEKLKEADFTEISFAAKVEGDKIMPLKEEESLIFTYLPTKCKDFKYPFLVNGSFLTNAAREGLHEDRIWNQWLFKLTAEKILDWLEMIAKSKFKFHILQLLPQKFASGHNELKNSFDRALETSVKQKAFLPIKSLKLKKLTEIIVDKTGLSDLNFISPETVIDYINYKDNTKFEPDSFVTSNLLCTDKLRSFGAKFFDAENLESFFLSAIFQENHQPLDNFALIEYFYNKATRDESREWNEKLKSIPFIYAEGKFLKSPQSICFPSITFETEFGESITVIHSDVYSKIESNNKVKNWLELLGVKEPSDTAYLENEIIGNLENCIDMGNYLKVTRYILNQHKKGLVNDWHYDRLQDLKIYTTSKEFKAAKECYLSDFYEPSLRLEIVNEAGKYVSETYKQQEDLVSEWKTLFLKIGISENISMMRIRTSINDNNGVEESYFKQVVQNAKLEHSYPHLVSSSNIVILDKIRYSEFASDHKFARVFWQQAIKTIHPHTISQYAYMPWGYYGSQCVVENYFYWSIENSEIFPSTTKDCLTAKQLYINDKEIVDIAGKYLPVFDYDQPLPDEWRQILPFKTKLELADYLIILQRIAEQTEEDEILRKYNKRRIGLIYNRIASLLSNFSDDKKQIILNWSNKNRLLSTGGKFENTTELKWIKIDGITTASDKLKVIHLPENCETQSREFEELISLFQVQIIDKFTPKFENVKRDIDLHNKLQDILPYFVAIIEKKLYVDYVGEFERLYTIISSAEFYNATEIKLSFKYQLETIEGTSLNVFRELNKLYFKGKWKSPITMFSLIPELSILMDISGINDELRLLLELDESEISDWLISLGYDISVIKARPEYQKAQQKIQIKQTNPQPLVGVVSESIKPEDEYSQHIIQEPEDFESEEDRGYNPHDESEVFTPSSTPKDFDTTKIPVTKKIFGVAQNVISIYSEIHSQDVREDVGRWSEEFVYEFLTRNKNDFSEVVWMNENGESGMPYDFKITENGKEKFIDVKGTPSNNKDIVYLSENEWKFMFSMGEDYSIYRIYNAGRHTAEIEIVENPSDLLIKGIIFPHPITLKI